MDRDDVVMVIKYYGNIDKETELQSVIRSKSGTVPPFDATQFKAAVADALCNLEYVEKDSIWMHYVESKQWSVVRRKHNYSDRQIRNKVRSALEKLRMVFDDTPEIVQFVNWKRQFEKRTEHIKFDT